MCTGYLPGAEGGRVLFSFRVNNTEVPFVFYTRPAWGTPNHYQKCSHIHIPCTVTFRFGRGSQKSEKCPFENFIRGPEEIVNLNDP